MPTARRLVSAARRNATKALRRAGLERIQNDDAGFPVPVKALRSGYLSDMGWYRTVAEERIVDAAGNPLPWLTYPAIHLLQARLPAEPFSVFEYGAGASTLWWAGRAASVTSVEHDEAWFSSLVAGLPRTARLTHVPLTDPEAYDKAILAESRNYDVVVIDGRRRVECSQYVPGRLTPRGIVIWDNSDRERYAQGLRQFERLGFRRLDLQGMAPRDTITSVTGILYRDGNLLGL